MARRIISLSIYIYQETSEINTRLREREVKRKTYGLFSRGKKSKMKLKSSSNKKHFTCRELDSLLKHLSSFLKNCLLCNINSQIKIKQNYKRVPMKLMGMSSPNWKANKKMKKRGTCQGQLITEKNPSQLAPVSLPNLVGSLISL